MKNPLSNLEPARVWHWFGEILAIPRPSKHEERISAYLVKWGKDHGLETHSDKLGNVLIRKPATKGYEKSPMVCLQAHMDMVCEKNSSSSNPAWNISNNPAKSTRGMDTGIHAPCFQ